MTSDIDKTLHVCTYTCAFHIVDIPKELCIITTYMVAMATLPLHVRSTLKYLAITSIRTVNSDAKLVWKCLILTRCKTYFLSYTVIHIPICNTVEHFITIPTTIKLSACAINCDV